MSYYNQVCLTVSDNWRVTKIKCVLLSHITGVLLELNPHIVSQQLEEGQIWLDCGTNYL
jgi:hypothetical protein